MNNYKLIKLSEGYIIISNEEIKEGDWVVFNELEIVKCTYSKNGEFLFSEPLTSSSNHHFSYFKKIIITTDQELIKDGVQAIDDEFLEWFVKNPSCEYIKIENVYDKFLNGDKRSVSDFRKKYKIIIPKEEIKQETIEDELWGNVFAKIKQYGLNYEVLTVLKQNFNISKR